MSPLRDTAAKAARTLPPVARLETRRWEARRRALIERTLDDPSLLARFAAHEPLPSGYGAGFDERVVEFPWLFAQSPAGRVLDAGSALNHQEIVQRLLPRVAALHVVTLAPEERSFNELGVSYLYADLRELPLASGHYDTIVSISTLEHVGMDNTHYGADTPAAGDPAGALRAAVAELRRVLAPGGTMLVSVPYGRPEAHGWLRQFDQAALEDLVSAAGPGEADIRVFRHGGDGWQPSTLGAAADSRYREHKAEAVACLRLTT